MLPFEGLLTSKVKKKAIGYVGEAQAREKAPGPMSPEAPGAEGVLGALNMSHVVCLIKSLSL